MICYADRKIARKSRSKEQRRQQEQKKNKNNDEDDDKKKKKKKNNNDDDHKKKKEQQKEKENDLSKFFWKKTFIEWEIKQQNLVISERHHSNPSKIVEFFHFQLSIKIIQNAQDGKGLELNAKLYLKLFF